jgi:hypothetical protein
MKWLGGSVAGVLGSIVLLGASGTFNATDAAAESPPNPAARYVGTVLVDGQKPPSGTVIEARIGAASCGVGTTYAQGSDIWYKIDVPALDPGATPNCGTDGASITFYIGGKLANESGAWRNYDINIINLTYTSPTPTPAASASVSATTGTAATPRPPAAGSGSQSGDTSAVWLFALLGAGALAFGAGGAAVARRSK